MSTIATIIVIAAALWVGFSGYSLLTLKAFVVDNLRAYGVPRSWWPWLGAAKTLGAVGLLVGLGVHAIGVAAAICVVAYFLGAAITVLRARAYSHVAYPLLYAVPAGIAGVLLSS